MFLIQISVNIFLFLHYFGPLKTMQNLYRDFYSHMAVCAGTVYANYFYNNYSITFTTIIYTHSR